MKQKTKWMEHVVRVGERRGAYRVLVRKPEEGKPLGRPKSIWKDNIKIDHQEVGWRHGLD
jgi:hypothetical protein